MERRRKKEEVLRYLQEEPSGINVASHGYYSILPGNNS